jgi:dihydroorotate dehydrogenase (fumarate)
MIDISVKYLGLTLKNPIIIGSCGLTSTIESLKKLESNGAAAIVLKSIFEEQIIREADYELSSALKDSLIYTQMSETLDYIDSHIKEKNINDYIQLIKKAKKELLIPVIASINCISADQWIMFAKKIQAAGADAIELNIFLNANDESDICFEETYKEIISQIKLQVTIPIAVKMTSSFSKISKTIQNLDKTGVDGVVLFNRYYSPDIDLETMKVISSHKFSHENDYSLPLRWIAATSDKVSCDLVASTGIHTGDSVIKQILVGAAAVQVVSAIYKNGPEHIQTMLADIEKWMDKKGYNYIDQFKGKLSISNKTNAAAFERIQFMKYFSEIE